nr:hypothetical protein Iba_chr06bCG2040 [Ipomoea batatas]
MYQNWQTRQLHATKLETAETVKNKACKMALRGNCGKGIGVCRRKIAQKRLQLLTIKGKQMRECPANMCLDLRRFNRKRQVQHAAIAELPQTSSKDQTALKRQEQTEDPLPLQRQEGDLKQHP